MFLVQGLTMAAAGVILLTEYLGDMGALVGRGGRDTLVPRLGLAYPLARRFRTGMTLAMFAIIVLTLVYMGEVSYMFRGRADDITRNLSGGFGVVLVSNPANPVSTADLATVPGVRRVAPLGYTTVEFTSPNRARTAWPVTGIGRDFASTPPKLRDRGGYPTDKAAWEAVSTNPKLAIVDDFFLQTPGGPTARAANIGDRIVMTDPLTGRSRSLTVAGLAENDYLLSGAYVNRDAMTEVFRERAVSSRFFVSADDPDAAVRRIRSTFIANGADAQTVHSVVTTALAQNSGFFTLLQQFVGAGLVVGIAGIGVIMFRAVRERRREVGVLRSLGFPRSWVGNVFMFEGGFVAALGVGLGVRHRPDRFLRARRVGLRLRGGIRMGSSGRRSRADRGNRPCVGGPRRARSRRARPRGSSPRSRCAPPTEHSISWRDDRSSGVPDGRHPQPTPPRTTADAGSSASAEPAPVLVRPLGSGEDRITRGLGCAAPRRATGDGRNGHAPSPNVGCAAGVRACM